MPEGQFEEISKTLVSLYQEIKHNSIWVSIVLGIQLLLKKITTISCSCSVWSVSKGQKSGSEKSQLWFLTLLMGLDNDIYIYHLNAASVLT